MRRLCLSAAVLLLVSACGGPQIITDRDPAIPIPDAATYTWRESGRPTLPGENAPEVQNPILQERIRRQIDANLAEKGFVLARDASTAQFVVHYHVGLRSRNETVTTARQSPAAMPTYNCWTRYCGPEWRWGNYGPPEYESRTYEYREGSLLVDLEQREPRKLAWRAIARDAVDKNSGTEESVKKYVRETLESLPAAHN